MNHLDSDGPINEFLDFVAYHYSSTQLMYYFLSKSTILKELKVLDKENLKEKMEKTEKKEKKINSRKSENETHKISNQAMNNKILIVDKFYNKIDNITEETLYYKIIKDKELREELSTNKTLYEFYNNSQIIQKIISKIVEYIIFYDLNYPKNLWNLKRHKSIIFMANVFEEVFADFSLDINFKISTDLIDGLQKIGFQKLDPNSLKFPGDLRLYQEADSEIQSNILPYDYIQIFAGYLRNGSELWISDCFQVDELFSNLVPSLKKNIINTQYRYINLSYENDKFKD